MSDAKKMARSGGTYFFLGVVFILLSLGFDMLLYMFQDKLNLGDVGIYLILIVQGIVTGFLVLLVAGWRKPIAGAVKTATKMVTLLRELDYFGSVGKVSIIYVSR